jgi:hypothetical protein
MAFWDRKKKDKKNKIKRKLVRTKSIQASEGFPDNLMLENLLTAQRINISVPGTTNAFKNYESQVDGTYRKYNSRDDFGNQQTRAVIDLRTAFIAGEGISVSAPKQQTAKWIEEFIKKNKLEGFNFVNAVKGCEMAGQSVLIMKMANDKQDKDKLFVKVRRMPYTLDNRYRPKYTDFMNDEVEDIEVKTDTGWRSLGVNNFIYVRTGGDDINFYGPVTKVGVVLTDLENYDRALRDLRRNNHIFARITPTFKTQNDTETKSLKATLNKIKWKIGHAFIGSAEFNYKTPGVSTHENLISEMTSTIKTISSITGVPVHWLGYVDLMSNRATADTLYEFIKNATISERIIWQESVYELILKAQEVYINNGGTGLSLDPNFQVRLPLISFENFLEKVRALSVAYGDEAISIDDYRNAIPGIDPLKTAKAIEDQKKKDQQGLIKSGVPLIPNILNKEGEEDNPGNPNKKENE